MLQNLEGIVAAFPIVEHHWWGMFHDVLSVKWNEMQHSRMCLSNGLYAMSAWRWPVLVLWLLVLPTTPHCRANEATDAIVALATSLSAQDALPPFWNLTDTEPAGVCAWVGVQCSADNRTVTGVNLTNVPMGGGVFFRTFEVLNRCTGLQYIILSNTGIRGPLNARWKNISSLRIVDAGNNLLTGTLPSGFWRNSNLEYIRLEHNQLSGELPRAWFRLRNVKHLLLGNNRLSGTVPSMWSTMEALQVLVLGKNLLMGPLPEVPGNLTTLSLWGNNFSGAIPKQYAQVKSLQVLLLDHNLLTGTLPSEWVALQDLTSLSLSNNTLQGTLPTKWSTLRQLTGMNLRQNRLEGTLPPTWSAMQRLHHLDLSQNRFSGSLPPEWSALKQLQRLYLWSNKIEGTLPLTWASMVSLQKLDLSGNLFGGQLPPEWASMRDMRELYLDDNRLTGPLPGPWKTMTKATMIDLGSNRISGSLPLEWAAMQELWSLSLRHNALRGPLPPAWSALTSLTLLSVSNNSLSGRGVPAAWKGMTNLSYLDISHNQLHGPAPLIEWASLNTLIASHNHFAGGLTSSDWPATPGFSIELSYNYLSGPLDWVQAVPSSVMVLNISANSFDSPTTEMFLLPERTTPFMIVLQEIAFQCPLPNLEALNPNVVLHVGACVPPVAPLVALGVTAIVLVVVVAIFRICAYERAMYLLQKGRILTLRYHPKYLLLLALGTFDLIVDPIAYWHMFAAAYAPSQDICAAIPLESVIPEQLWHSALTNDAFFQSFHAVYEQCFSFPHKMHRCFTHEESYVRPIVKRATGVSVFFQDQRAQHYCDSMLWTLDGKGEVAALCAFDTDSRSCRRVVHIQADRKAVFRFFLVVSCVVCFLKELLKLLGVLYIIVVGMVSPGWLAFIRDAPFIVLLMMFKPLAAQEACLHEYSTKQILLALAYETILENAFQMVLTLTFTLSISQGGINLWVCITLLNNVAATCYRFMRLVQSCTNKSTVTPAPPVQLFTASQLMTEQLSSLPENISRNLHTLDLVQSPAPLGVIDSVEVQPRNSHVHTVVDSCSDSSTEASGEAGFEFIDPSIDTSSRLQFHEVTDSVEVQPRHRVQLHEVTDSVEVQPSQAHATVYDCCDSCAEPSDEAGSEFISPFTVPSFVSLAWAENA